MPLHRKTSLLSLTLVFLMLSACAGGKPHISATAPQQSGPIADLRTFPQDLTVYARSVGQSKRLLSADEQAQSQQRFLSKFFGPWAMTRSTVRKSEVSGILRKARGYKHGDVRWTQEEWDVIAANANMKDFPCLARPAITLRNTDLREIPTHETRFTKPVYDAHEYPFDEFQYSLLPIGTPLFVTHVSNDRRWLFVECPVAAGWVDANDVAPADESFRQQWRTGRYAALVRDKVSLGNTLAGIGTVLPLTGASGSSLSVLCPVAGPDGMARVQQVTLSKNDAAPMPLPLTPGNVAQLGNHIMGTPYGWGGMFGNRDCSALTRDLLAPFGIWLPRNSRPQAATGIVQPLDGMSADEKERIILSQGTPFLSLVGMRGHIMLYVGKHKGRAAIFHDLWGVRVIDGANDNGRCVVGKAVVTSITPGIELPNLYRTKTFVDHLRTLSTPRP
ncbi:MAG: SH3 domain-containing protein [Desulfovibrio sp.]|nr:SH3 domain-containing protein [Desulfovibrio sp.]